MKKSFTIIEVIIAIFILMIGAGAAFALLNHSLSTLHHLKSRLIAAYLAQEGIEVIRNIRDRNWLQNQPWTNGISTSLPCGVDYEDYSCNAGQEAFNLRIDPEGFYRYYAGSETKFKRKIKLDSLNANTLEITVTVSWQEKGINQEFKAKEIIYNWLR